MHTTKANQIMLKNWFVLSKICLNSVCLNEVLLYLHTIQVLARLHTRGEVHSIIFCTFGRLACTYILSGY